MLYSDREVLTHRWDGHMVGMDSQVGWTHREGGTDGIATIYLKIICKHQSCSQMKNLQCKFDFNI